MRASPVATSVDSDVIRADAPDLIDSCEVRTPATRENAMVPTATAGPRPRDNVSCGDDVVLITHVDGRRFPNPEQREKRGLPAHIPKYDA